MYTCRVAVSRVVDGDRHVELVDACCLGGSDQFAPVIRLWESVPRRKDSLLGGSKRLGRALVVRLGCRVHCTFGIGGRLCRRTCK